MLRQIQTIIFNYSYKNIYLQDYYTKVDNYNYIIINGVSFNTRYLWNKMPYQYKIIYSVGNSWSENTYRDLQLPKRYIYSGIY